MPWKEWASLEKFGSMPLKRNCSIKEGRSDGSGSMDCMLTSRNSDSLVFITKFTIVSLSSGIVGGESSSSSSSSAAVAQRTWHMEVQVLW